ncbi:MAG: hypothetical protein AB8B53_06365 [Flavobacteriales bacterium]
MKTVLAFLALFLSNHLCAQDDIEIAHFQRNGKLSKLLIPGDQFNPSLTLITLPDSTYSKGTVKIRKVKCDKIILKDFGYSFSNDTIRKTIYQVRGDKSLSKLREYWNNRLIDSSSLNFSSDFDQKVKITGKEQEIRIRLIKVRKRYFLSLNLE